MRNPFRVKVLVAQEPSFGFSRFLDELEEHEDEYIEVGVINFKAPVTWWQRQHVKKKRAAFGFARALSDNQ